MKIKLMNWIGNKRSGKQWEMEGTEEVKIHSQPQDSNWYQEGAETMKRLLLGSDE